MQTKILQAEVEQLNKETNALATSNHKLQTDSNHTRVQISVAMETVNELENKKNQLEDIIAKYEHEVRMKKIPHSKSRRAECFRRGEEAASNNRRK